VPKTPERFSFGRIQKEGSLDPIDDARSIKSDTASLLRKSAAASSRLGPEWKQPSMKVVSWSQ